MRALAALLLVGVVGMALSGCGGSSQNGRIVAVCRATPGHTVDSPVSGSIVALGRPPIYVRVDNAGDLNAGQVVLGKTDYPGWFALKTHFFTPPSFRGGFSVRVRGINGSGVVGIGGQPPGGTFSAPAGPAANTSKDWREWPAFTWVKGPGCYLYTIKGAGLLEERVVVAALSG